MQFRFKSYSHIPGAILIIGFLVLAGCSKKLSHEGKVVFTQIPVSSVDVEHINTIENKYAPSMKIAIAEMDEGLQNINILTSEFSSARSPEISFDGLMMVFSGQKDDGDPWQIWKMDLETKEIYQVTESRTNCTDPTWIPNGHIAFSKLVTDVKALKYHALYTIGADGCCEERITFQPHEDVNANVLHDGRIIVASRQVYPKEGPFKYLTIRPDGTKAEVFYLANDMSNKISKAVENEDGLVLFSEHDAMNSINFSRPLHTKNSIELKPDDLINSIFLYEKNELLISIKKQVERSYGLALINLEQPAEFSFYYNNSEYHAMEAAIVRSRATPRNLPSRVNHEMNSGYFFSMNVDASDIVAQGKTTKVQVLGMNDMIGEASVSEDGSFYLKLAADRPVRLQTLDEKGKVLRGPSSWMWVRPNERRGCAGCHQDREISPENIVPKAMEKAPITMIR